MRLLTVIAVWLHWLRAGATGGYDVLNLGHPPGAPLKVLFQLFSPPLFPLSAVITMITSNSGTL